MGFPRRLDALFLALKKTACGFTPPKSHRRVSFKRCGLRCRWYLGHGTSSTTCEVLVTWQPLLLGNWWIEPAVCPADSWKRIPGLLHTWKSWACGTCGWRMNWPRYMCWNLSEIHWHTREWFTVSHLKLLLPTHFWNYHIWNSPPIPSKPRVNPQRFWMFIIFEKLRFGHLKNCASAFRVRLVRRLAFKDQIT